MPKKESDMLNGYFSRPSRVGYSHSYTAEETKSVSGINKYLLLAKIRGETLIDYTKPDWYYCVVEDGRVFKYNPQELLFYRLDLERFVWVRDQTFASLCHDTYLMFQEIAGFRDYFPHDKIKG